MRKGDETWFYQLQGREGWADEPTSLSSAFNPYRTIRSLDSSSDSFSDSLARLTLQPREPKNGKPDFGYLSDGLARLIVLSRKQLGGY